MPRKKQPSSVTEKEVFPTRLREMMKEHGITQKMLGDYVGVRPQTISLYTTGQSYPDVNGIRKISKYFEVCSDYLLGLSDAPTIDVSEQAVVDALGLDYRAVRYLFAAKRSQEAPHKGVERQELLSFLLSNIFFDGMLVECCTYIDKKREDSDMSFFNDPESCKCREILKKYGYEISTKDEQASYIFNEKIVPLLRDLLNEYANPGEFRKEMNQDAKYTGEDNEDRE